MPDEEPDLDLAAASLRADRGDLDAYVEGLAARLADALPGQVEVERRRTRLFGGPRRVHALRAALGDTTFSLARSGHRLAGRREQVVRGVRIKGEDLALDAWIDALVAELGEEARSSARAREALGRLVG